MKKLKMEVPTMTSPEGCNKYLEYCRQRNLREGSISHYKHSYKQFYKFFDPDMPIVKIDAEAYNRFVLYLKGILDNDTFVQIIGNSIGHWLPLCSRFTLLALSQMPFFMFFVPSYRSQNLYPTKEDLRRASRPDKRNASLSSDAKIRI